MQRDSSINNGYITLQGNIEDRDIWESVFGEIQGWIYVRW